MPSRSSRRGSARWPNRRISKNAGRWNSTAVSVKRTTSAGPAPDFAQHQLGDDVVARPDQDDDGQHHQRSSCRQRSAVGEKGITRHRRGLRETAADGSTDAAHAACGRFTSQRPNRITAPQAIVSTVSCSPRTSHRHQRRHRRLEVRVGDRLRRRDLAERVAEQHLAETRVHNRQVEQAEPDAEATSSRPARGSSSRPTVLESGQSDSSANRCEADITIRIGGRLASSGLPTGCRSPRLACETIRNAVPTSMPGCRPRN